MSDPAADLDRIIDALDEDVETAPGRLRSRAEFKAARAFLEVLRTEVDALKDDADAASDRVREAEAQRDLLALARDEEEQAQITEDQLKRELLRQDEAVLARVEGELKVYWLLIGLGFVVPILVIMPFGTWCMVGLVPVAWGVGRIVNATADMQGRTWVVFMDHVTQVKKKLLFAHGMAGASAVLVVLWFVFALLRREVEAG